MCVSWDKVEQRFLPHSSLGLKPPLERLLATRGRGELSAQVTRGAEEWLESAPLAFLNVAAVLKFKLESFSVF